MYSSLYKFKLVHNKLKENFSLFGLAGQQCIVARGDVRARVGTRRDCWSSMIGVYGKKDSRQETFLPQTNRH